EQPNSDGRIAHAKVSLQVHHRGWLGQAVPHCVLRDQSTELVTGDEELAGEHIGEPFPTKLRAWHRHDDVKTTRVEERMGELVGGREDLAAEGHVRVDQNRKPSCGWL